MSWLRILEPDRRGCRTRPREVGELPGTFTDPNDYLWNVAVGEGRPIAAE